MKTRQRPKDKISGFTLVEVLVSITIVAIVGIGGYTAFLVLSGENEASRNRLHAIALGQQALEEIKTVAYNSFDTLTSANFPDNIDQRRYPGFHRNVVISTDPTTTELKKADVSISWSERNRPRQYNLSLLLARPPEPLPANIHGVVTNKKTGTFVENATVYIQHASSPGLNATTTTAANGSYSFVDVAGNPRLKPGDWSLSAGRSGYYDFRTLVSNLDSGEDRVVNIELDPKPGPAKIKGKVLDLTRIDSVTGGYSAAYSSLLYIVLYEKGRHLSAVCSQTNLGNFEFIINFDDENPRSFTLATAYYYWRNLYYRTKTYWSGWCGNFSDSHGWGRHYNYRGWSSSVVRQDGSVIPFNPWEGNTSTDRINVNPGDEVTVNIPLVPVPKATLQGYVYDSNRNVVGGAQLISRWHDSGGFGSTYTDSTGFYTMSIPAVQELFPSYYWARVSVSGSLISAQGSCGLQESRSTSLTEHIMENIIANAVYTKDFILPRPRLLTYGNATGDVVDGKTLGPLAGVSVGIWGWKQTDLRGVYDFSCSPQQTEAGFFMIPVGFYTVYAMKGGYYDFNSRGNDWYSPYPYLWGITILPRKTTSYKTIRLWPKNIGTITGRIVEGGAERSPISGATIKLVGPENRTTTTGGNGTFTFSGVCETWPPKFPPGTSHYYRHDRRDYTLTASYTEAYDPEEKRHIILNEDNAYFNDVGDIVLRKKSQW